MSPRSPASRALGLTDPIYAAAVDPTRWPDFLEALSEELGGATIAMSLMLPGWDLPVEYYRVGLSAEYAPAFERHFRAGLPWPMTDPLFRNGFARGSELLPDAAVRDTGYYRDYLAPQDLAPEGPVAHLISDAEGRPISGISIQRRVGDRVLTDEDVATCNHLVPHLALANAIRNERVRGEQERDARVEILDRLPVGVVILDEGRRTVVASRVAQAMLDERDGLLLRDGILHASHPRDERVLQDLIRTAIRLEPAAGYASSPFEGSFLSITRPSGAPPYSLVIARVFSAPKAAPFVEEVAAIFVTNPTPERIGQADIFREWFGLTLAESEVVSLLAAGHSLDAISEQRGVSLNTTRTLLKRIFRKTRTRRQGEIVRLVLSAGVTDGRRTRDREE